MHYVINAQHRAQETPTVHSCACCSLLYGIYLPFPISFLSLSLSYFSLLPSSTFMHAFKQLTNLVEYEIPSALPSFPSSPKQTRIRKSGTRVLFYSPLTEHRFDWIECRWGEEVGDKWGEKRGEEIKEREESNDSSCVCLSYLRTQVNLARCSHLVPFFFSSRMDDSSRSSSTVGVPKFSISWRIFIFFDYPSFIIAVYLNLVIEKWKEEENDPTMKRM